MSIKFKPTADSCKVEVYVANTLVNKGGEKLPIYTYLTVDGGEENIVNGKSNDKSFTANPLIAVYEAIYSIKNKCKTIVYTNDKLVFNAISKGWYKGWRKRGWKKVDGGELVNREYWIKLIKEIEKFDSFDIELVDKSSNLPYMDIVFSELDNYSLSFKDKKFNKKVIAVDFDGTITTGDSYPEIGTVDEKAVEVINKIKNKGHEIIIWTCRDSWVIEETLLDYGIKYDSINENTPYLKGKWGNNPRKVGADILIDDKSLFYVNDWSKIERELVRIGVL